MLKWIGGILTAVITGVLTAVATGLIPPNIGSRRLPDIPKIGLPNLDVGCSANPDYVRVYQYGNKSVSAIVVAVVTFESAPVQKASVQLQASEGYFESSRSSIEVGETDPHGMMRVMWRGEGPEWFFWSRSKTIYFRVNANKKGYDTGDGGCTTKVRVWM